MNLLLKIARSKNVKSRLAQVSATAQRAYEQSRGSDNMVRAGQSGFGHKYSDEGSPINLRGKATTADKTRKERFDYESNKFGKDFAKGNSGDISKVNNWTARQNRGHESGKGAGKAQSRRDAARAADNQLNKAKESSISGQAASDKQPPKFGLSRGHKIAIGVGAVGAAGVTAAGLYGAKKLRDHIKAKKQKDEVEKPE
jgi:hypothetical protein